MYISSTGEMFIGKTGDMKMDGVNLKIIQLLFEKHFSKMLTGRQQSLEKFSVFPLIVINAN
jgi:hypothetical protein